LFKIIQGEIKKKKFIESTETQSCRNGDIIIIIITIIYLF